MDTRSLTGESAEFSQALRDLRGIAVRPEVRLTEVPAPTRIAPCSVALTAEVRSAVRLGRPGAEPEQDLASGRFVLLHDPGEPEPWGGQWRAVTFARAELEPELASDPMLGAVGWSWLTESLQAAGAQYSAEAGTVTRVVSESFAGLADRPAGVEMEIRASWSPSGPQVGAHLQAWCDLLCTIAGLPPLPDGVIALPGQRL